MRVSSRIGLGLVASALVVLGGGRAGAGKPRAPVSACRATHPPSVGDGQNRLLGVTVTSARDAWAVGSAANAAATRTRSLIERFNGRAWSVAPNPSPGQFDELLGVSASSARDAWAVGDYYATGGPDLPLLEHYDGRAWTAQPAPAAWTLQAVAARSPHDVWAVGSRSDEPLVIHFDGRAWRSQPLPGLGSASGALSGVTAVSRSEVWAVGYSGAHALIEHFNGHAWRVQRSPTPHLRGFGGQVGSQLFGVAATSGANAWAAGYAYASLSASGGEYSQTLIERWDGRAWHLQRSPNPDGGILALGTSQLFGIAAVSGTDAWAVGGFVNGATVQRWQHRAWRLQASGAGRPGNATLFGVAGRAPATVWAVGDAGAGNLALACR